MKDYGASTVNRHRRTAAQLQVVDEAIVEVVRAEAPISLRGVFYRVMSAGAVDKTELGYRLVGRQLLKLRRCGAVPYSAITDGTRYIVKPESWSDVDTMLRDAAASYRRALWRSQPVDCHVFVEKDAITGVIEPVTSEWDVPLGVLRGYASESFTHSVAEAVAAAGKPVILYHLGDHDPSGLDAWRDFQTKVASFVGGAEVTFERLAVTEQQVADWSLPTRPTKRTDSRSARFRGDSVEVDAIPTARLRQLVESAITRHLDEHALRVTEYAERQERELLYRMVGVATGGGR